MSFSRSTSNSTDPVPTSLLGVVLDRTQECHAFVTEIDGLADRILGALPPRPESKVSAVPSGALGEVTASVDALRERLASLRDRFLNIA